MAKSNFLKVEDPSTELAITEAVVAELEDYLIKDDLYRTVLAQTPEGRSQHADDRRRSAGASAPAARRDGCVVGE